MIQWIGYSAFYTKIVMDSTPSLFNSVSSVVLRIPLRGKFFIFLLPYEFRLEQHKQRRQYGQAYKGVGEHRQGDEQAKIA